MERLATSKTQTKPVPFASSVLYATEALKLAGGAAATHWLPKLADGSAIGTVAFTEGRGTWDARPTARVENGRLFGCKEPVADPAADFRRGQTLVPEIRQLHDTLGIPNRFHHRIPHRILWLH